MKKKIVLTGATGFVGSNLTKYFLERNIEVHIIVRPTSKLTQFQNLREKPKVFIYDNDLNLLTNFLKEVQPECVIHIASNFIVNHKPSEIKDLVESNILFGLHLLEGMKEAGINKFINTGTSWQHYNNEEYNPVCLYAATKEAFENLLEYYVKAEQFKAITLKLFDTYGETDTRPKLINLLNKFADEQNVLEMSPGLQILNLVHIDDVCKAFDTAYQLLLNKKEAEHLKYTVAHKKTYTLQEVIKVFESVKKKKINVVWGGKSYRKREMMIPYDLGVNLPNWISLISLEEGLSRS